MSYFNTALYQAIRAKYATSTSLSTEYPNESFTKPTATNWARFKLVIQDDIPKSIGDTRKLVVTPCTLYVQLFAPQDMGAVDIMESADSIADAFRSWNDLPYVSCLQASVNPIGNNSDGWYQVNVVIDFRVQKLC